MSIEREFVEAVARGDAQAFARKMLGDRANHIAAPIGTVTEKMAQEILKDFPEPGYPRCKTCKWWEGPHPVRPTGHAKCRSTKACETFSNNRTGPDFGCVHHEKREEKPAPTYGELMEKLKAVAEAAVSVFAAPRGWSGVQEESLKIALEAAGYMGAKREV